MSEKTAIPENNGSSPRKKNEPWPIAIVMAFVVFMSLIIVAVIIMWQVDIPLVAEDYYAKEIVFQEQIDAELVTNMMKKHPLILLKPGSDSLLINYPLDTAYQRELAGELHFFRPSDAKLDQRFAVKPDQTGLQLVDVSTLKPGYWILKINWSEDGVKFYHEETLHL